MAGHLNRFCWVTADKPWRGRKETMMRKLWGSALYRLKAADITCDPIFSCPGYKHLASSGLLFSVDDQRHSETDDCSKAKRNDSKREERWKETSKEERIYSTETCRSMMLPHMCTGRLHFNHMLIRTLMKILWMSSSKQKKF